MEGKVLFVPFTAPGDVVDVRIVRTRRQFAEGVVERLVSPSPCVQRLFAPILAHAEAAGGNTYRTKNSWNSSSSKFLTSSPASENSHCLPYCPSWDQKTRPDTAINWNSPFPIKAGYRPKLRLKTKRCSPPPWAFMYAGVLTAC